MKHRIAFIGFGTIARDVAAGLRSHLDVDLAALCRRPDTPLDVDVQCLADTKQLLAWKPELVIEAASQAAVSSYAEVFLAQGIPVLITSIGALVDETCRQRLRDAARQGDTRILVPAGAVASLDYLQAVRHTTDVRVTYESRKPVAAWRDELAALGHDVARLDRAVTLYDGDAAQAARAYPKNLNVAATLALAGIGMEATRVRVVADPAVNHNQHTIRVESALGTLQTQLINQPSPDNPKTSRVVAQSVLATVLRQFDPLQIA